MTFLFWTCFLCSKTSLEETVSGLKSELEHSLVSNQEKRQQIKQLQSELQQTKGSLREQEKKAERAEQIAMEQEVGNMQIVQFTLRHVYSTEKMKLPRIRVYCLECISY